MWTRFCFSFVIDETRRVNGVSLVAFASNVRRYLPKPAALTRSVTTACIPDHFSHWRRR